eukprot:gene18564-22212_t
MHKMVVCALMHRHHDLYFGCQQDFLPFIRLQDLLVDHKSTDDLYPLMYWIWTSLSHPIKDWNQVALTYIVHFYTMPEDVPSSAQVKDLKSKPLNSTNTGKVLLSEQEMADIRDNPTLLMKMMFDDLLMELLESTNQYQFIHRCFHMPGFSTDPNTPTGFQWLQDVNKHIKRFYAPGNSLSSDDDLFKWKGKGGGKKQVDGKADDKGIMDWKVADDSHYISHLIHEYIIKPKVVNEKGHPKLNNLILKDILDNMLAVGRASTRGTQYNFSIDAGMLGSVENAMTLAGHKQYFIIMTTRQNGFNVFTPILLDDAFLEKEYNERAANGGKKKRKSREIFRDKIVEERRKNKDDLDYIDDIKYGSNDFFTAVAWRARNKKVCYFLTNIPQPFEPFPKDATEKRIEDKRIVREIVSRPAPRCAFVYTICHNYIDSGKMCINPNRNVHRARTFWRVMFHEALYILVFNCWVLHKMIMPDTELTNLKSFILSLVNDYFINISSPARHFLQPSKQTSFVRNFEQGSLSKLTEEQRRAILVYNVQRGCSSNSQLPDHIIAELDQVKSQIYSKKPHGYLCHYCQFNESPHRENKRTPIQSYGPMMEHPKSLSRPIISSERLLTTLPPPSPPQSPHPRKRIRRGSV